MRKLVSILIAVLIMTVGLAGCGVSDDKKTDNNVPSNTVSGDNTSKDNTSDSNDGGANPEDTDELMSGTHHAKINIKDYGTISVELYADKAPITVTNFVNLAKSGFYDGLTFHRVISGFMIQGGDPDGDGTGGSDENIKGEFSLNGVENDISHVRGVISMARSSAYDSASSQFFIMHEDTTGLDGQYAAFGMVTEGIEIVDKICEDTPVIDGDGTVKEGYKPVIESIEVVD